MAQAGFIFVRIFKDLKTQSYQLLPAHLNLPLLFGLGFFFIGVEVEEPFGLALYSLCDFLPDFALLVLVLGGWFKEKFCDFRFLIAKDLVGSIGGFLYFFILEFLVGDIEGELNHPEGEGLVPVAVLDELGEMRPDL